jgi:hypothetical protein
MAPPRLQPFLACALLAVVGCDQAADPARESGPRVDHAEASAYAGDAQRRDSALPLPADFPDDVYLPDRYAVTSVIDLGGTRVVSVTSRGKVAQLFADARAEMTRGGWTQVMSMQHSADNAMLSFEKGGRATVFSFNRGEGADTVVIGVQIRDDARRDGS